MEWFIASEYPPIGKQQLPFSFSIFFSLGPDYGALLFTCFPTRPCGADVCECPSSRMCHDPRIDGGPFFGRLVPRVLKLCFSLTGLRFEIFGLFPYRGSRNLRLNCAASHPAPHCNAVTSNRICGSGSVDDYFFGKCHHRDVLVR